MQPQTKSALPPPLPPASASPPQAEGLHINLVFTSRLQRAIKTSWIILEDLSLFWVDQVRSWRLNERMYGALQGLNKKETVDRHGEAQVALWRRSYDVPPPPLTKDSGIPPPSAFHPPPLFPLPRPAAAYALRPEHFPGHDARYADVAAEDLPLAECLADTVARVVPFWDSDIAPAIRAGRGVMVAAHGNSLRALVKHLDHISDAEIAELNIPTGIPLLYTLDADLKPVK
jgi:2,3-bisphosphoglycerate-dependent phosphoglycerate mutase